MNTDKILEEIRREQELAHKLAMIENLQDRETAIFAALAEEIANAKESVWKAVGMI